MLPDSHASWVQGPASPPLLEITIGQALDQAARRWGDADALVSVAQSIRWTWSEFAHRADALAAGLLALGMAPGDRIGIWSHNCAEWTLTQFAAAKIGLILTSINPAYRTSELAFVLHRAGVKAVVSAERYRSSDYLAMLDEVDVPSLKHKISLGESVRAGWLRFADIPGLAAETDLRCVRDIGGRLDRNDAINILFTSGTTGRPKGATLSHRNVLNNGRFVGQAQQLGSHDRICVPVPLYHCFGLVLGNLASLTCGAAMVYPSTSFDPMTALTAVEQERCTALYGVPSMFIAVLGHPEFGRFDLSSLRTGVMAGSPCPINVMRQVVERMGMTGVTIAYGMTETSPVSFQSALDDSLERRVSTIGRVQPHLEVKAIDERGQITPRGVPGELCTRGYAVMLGYWDDPQGTAEAIDSEGWMHTGDLGTIDEQNYGNIVGRIKDMIIRGGENIYPREIEEFLHTHPKIADVQVVGIPDALLGEEVCAWIRLTPGVVSDEKEIRDFCRNRIAHFKIPRYVRFVNDFPLTASGKVQKFVIREQMTQEMSLSAPNTA